VALRLVKALRFGFDLGTRFNKDKMTEKEWLNRCVFLETIAGVPGMVGGMARHMKSLRTLRHDHGLIHHLLNEAENERTHLFIFLKLKNPSRPFQLAVALSQGLFFNFYFFLYMIWPRLCHRFVGYLEEEAVHTYTMLLAHLDQPGRLPRWEAMEAPKLARDYYELPETALMKDMILAIRADESIHRDLNHKFAEIVRPTIQEDNNSSTKNEVEETPIDCELEIMKILEKDYRIKKGAFGTASKVTSEI
jgi:hypothetical protein